MMWWRFYNQISSCCCKPRARPYSRIQLHLPVVVWWHIDLVEWLKYSWPALLMQMVLCWDIVRTMDTPLWQVHSLPRMCWSLQRWSSSGGPLKSTRVQYSLWRWQSGISCEIRDLSFGTHWFSNFRHQEQFSFIYTTRDIELNALRRVWFQILRSKLQITILTYICWIP